MNFVFVREIYSNSDFQGVLKIFKAHIFFATSFCRLYPSIQSCVGGGCRIFSLYSISPFQAPSQVCVTNEIFFCLVIGGLSITKIFSLTVIPLMEDDHEIGTVLP